MKRAVLMITSVMVLSLTTGCALFYPNYDSNQTPSDPMNPSPTESSTVSPEPTESPNESATPTPSKLSAKPRVLYYEVDAAAGNLLVIGEIINVAESGGKCTVTFYSGNTPLAQQSVSAEINVSTTQCFPVQIPLSKLPKGTGQVVVSYESEGYQGDSERFEVIIP